MKAENIVKLVVEYLAVVKERPDNRYSLLQLMNFADYTDRNIPTLEEILCGIERIGGISLVKKGDLIYFSATPDPQDKVETITEQDFQFAHKQYSKEF